LTRAVPGSWAEHEEGRDGRERAATVAGTLVVLVGLAGSPGSALAANLPPEFTPSNVPSSIQFPAGVKLTLPTLEAGARTIGP